MVRTTPDIEFVKELLPGLCVMSASPRRAIQKWGATTAVRPLLLSSRHVSSWSRPIPTRWHGTI